MGGIRCHPELPFVSGDDSMLTHQTSYPMLTTGIIVSVQLRMDSGTSYSQMWCMGG